MNAAELRDATALRFWAKVDKTGLPDNDCWLWLGSLDNHGYGCFHLDGATRKAHRIAFEFTRGPIPNGLHLDHLCRVRNCVNPTHLDPVTNAENGRRGLTAISNVLRIKEQGGYGRALIRLRQTTCESGHPFDGTNTIHRKSGGRDCRACANERNRQYRKRLAGVAS